MSAVHALLGQKIRTARLRAGMTQSELARAVKTSERNIVRWENSRNAPRMESVVAIARATGRPVDEFMSDDDEEAAPPMGRDLLEQLYLQLGTALGKELVR